MQLLYHKLLTRWQWKYTQEINRMSTHVINRKETVEMKTVEMKERKSCGQVGIFQLSSENDLFRSCLLPSSLSWRSQQVFHLNSCASLFYFLPSLYSHSALSSVQCHSLLRKFFQPAHYCLGKKCQCKSREHRRVWKLKMDLFY